MLTGFKTFYAISAITLLSLISGCEGTSIRKTSVDRTPPVDPNGLTWSTASPINTTSVTATWQVSSSADLANQKIQIYTGTNCNSTFGSLIDLASKTTATQNFTGVDGTSYTYRVTSIDFKGNTSTSPCSSVMAVDTTPPTIAITSPANAGWINVASNSVGYVVSGTCSENGQSVTIKIDNTANGSAICMGGVFSTNNVNTTALSQAAHNFTATISDLAGNTTVSAINSVTYDTVKPTLVITGPAGSNPANSTGATTYTLTFADTNTVAPVAATVQSAITFGGTSFGGCNVTTTPVTCAALVCTVTVKGCTGNGTADIIVGTAAYADAAVVAAAGNPLVSAVTSSTFVTNNTAPSIAITTPANNTWINIANNSTTFAVSGTCTEPTQSQLTGQTVTIKIDGGAVTTTPSPITCTAGGTFSGTIDTTPAGITAGAHTFTATITDLASNTTTSSSNTVTKDIIKPTVAFTTGPSVTSISSAGSTVYTLTFSDANLGAPVAATVTAGITINGTSAGCTKSTTIAGAVATVTITGCTGNGTASITVNAGAYSDNAGNPLTANGPSATFTVNNTAPSIAVTTPANNSWINIANNSTTFTVSGTCTEATQAQVTGQAVTLKIDGVASGTTPLCTGGGTFNGTVDTTGLAAGAHTFTATITDLAANTTTSTSNTVTKDVIAPTVVISAASVSPVNSAGSTAYTLTFTDVNLGALNNATINAGITINGTNAGCVATTTGAGATIRTVTITGCTGNGTASITAASAAWSDLASNPLTANGPSGTFLVNNTAPSIAVTTPANSSWINIANNSATFAFSGTCTEATQSQVTGQTVTLKIDGVASGTTPLCTGGGTFNGTVDTTGLAAGAHTFTATITDLAANTTTSASNTVTKDVIAPTVVISAASVGSINSAGSTAYTLTFTDVNLGTLSNATINAGITINGTNAGCVATTTGAGATVRTVTITGCSGNGTASITAGSTTWSDLASNPLTANGPSGTFIVNNTAPSIAVTTPANNSWINIANNSTTFVVSGTCTEATQSQMTGQAVTLKIDGVASGTTPLCTGGGTFSGTVNTTGLTAGAHTFSATITDLAANTTTSTSNTVTKDVIAPTVAISAASVGSINSAGSTAYTLTFTDVNLGTLSNATINAGITINGTNAGCVATTTGAGATVRTVTITSCSGNGTASITAGSTTWSDLASNPLTANGPSGTFIVNNTAPSIAVTTPANSSWINIANNSATFAVSGTCTETTQSQLTGQSVTLKIDGIATGTTPLCTGGGTFSGTVDTTGLAAGAHTFSATITDLATNSTSSSANTVTKDIIAPVVVIGAASASLINSAASSAYILTFTDVNLGTLSNATINAGITINGANTGCSAATTGAGATARTVTISGCTGNGTVSITAGSTTWSDLAGNPLTANGPSGTFTVDNTAPTVTSVTTTKANGTYHKADSMSITVNFSENVTVTGGPPRLTLNTTPAETINYVSGSGSTALVFTYVVQTSDMSAKLDYAAITSLVLNGSTMQDAALNNATLTLPTLDGGSSLSGASGTTKLIVIDTTAALTWVTDTSPYDFSTQSTSTVTHTFTLKNTGWGQTTAAISSGGLTGVDASKYQVMSDTCNTATLTQNSTCTINVKDLAGTQQEGTFNGASFTETAGSLSASMTLNGIVACPYTKSSWTAGSTGNSYTVPGGCNSISTKVWGGGGGSGNGNGGGGGGYVGGVKAVNPGDIITVNVGGGGDAWNGGGINGGGASGLNGAGGGGYSSIANAAGTTYYFIAGGGGGSAFSTGGPGGGTSGLNGTSPTSNRQGLGGTSIAGGAGGAGAGPGTCASIGQTGNVNGTAGSSMQGGTGGNCTGVVGGGGGGGGYFGGGGGGGEVGDYNHIGGGGGGSSYTDTSIVGAIILAGSGPNPGNPSDGDVGTAAIGGNNSGGNDGKVVIIPVVKRTFATATTGLTYTVPATCTKIFTRAWGAGGGSGGNAAGYGNGGGGGYATTTIAVSGGDPITYMVGGGGGMNGGGTSMNGGGASGGSGGGAGGGYSGIKISGTIVLISGGGAGGGAITAGSHGGAGGGTTGLSGAVAEFGTGGTQTGGGNFGSSVSCGGAANGNAGLSLQGGAGGTCAGWTSSGGGGGGYFGGGGGAGDTGGYSGGGGGGSSYMLTGANYSNTSTNAGTGSTPGNSTDADRGTAGKGGVPDGGLDNGNPGLVVIVPVDCT